MQYLLMLIIIFEVVVIIVFCFQDVNTEVCEQLFSWLPKFSVMTKHMNRWHFLFIMLLNSHNEFVDKMNKN